MFEIWFLRIIEFGKHTRRQRNFRGSRKESVPQKTNPILENTKDKENNRDQREQKIKALK